MNSLFILKKSDLFKPISHQTQLVWHLVKRDFILQYKRSFLGVLWSLLLPLGQLIVLVLVFQKILPLRIEAYPAFLLSALLPWSWFSNCISTAGGLFIHNRDLVRRPNFEPAILIIVNVFSNLLLFLVALPILFIVMIFYGKPFAISICILPLLLIVQIMLISGLSLIIATINTFYSDVQHIVTVALMMLFFLTPVFYDYSAIGENFRVLYFINPMASLIQNYRLIIYGGIFPSLNSMLFLIISSIVACIIGYLVYRSRIEYVIDII
jgi:lipopolysaccharide transport system permease protein